MPPSGFGGNAQHPGKEPEGTGYSTSTNGTFSSISFWKMLIDPLIPNKN